jgi:hypothetical protein
MVRDVDQVILQGPDRGVPETYVDDLARDVLFLDPDPRAAPERLVGLDLEAGDDVGQGGLHREREGGGEHRGRREDRRHVDVEDHAQGRRAEKQVDGHQ